MVSNLVFTMMYIYQSFIDREMDSGKLKNWLKIPWLVTGTIPNPGLSDFKAQVPHVALSSVP